MGNLVFGEQFNTVGTLDLTHGQEQGPMARDSNGKVGRLLECRRLHLCHDCWVGGAASLVF